MRLYCNRYAHFKHPLVCSVNCPYRTRCRDFALFYDENRAEVDRLVEDYFDGRAVSTKSETERQRAFMPTAAPVSIGTLIRLEVKLEMAEAKYIWIGKDDQAELLELDEVIRRAERGSKAKHIFKVAQEMELRFQLVPLKRIEKAKRAAEAEAERSAARRRAHRPRPRPVPVETPAALKPVPAIEAAPQAPPARRTRTRIAKAAGER